MRKITILGSTGSIGTQSLDVIKTLDDASVFALCFFLHVSTPNGRFLLPADCGCMKRRSDTRRLRPALSDQKTAG